MNERDREVPPVGSSDGVERFQQRRLDLERLILAAASRLLAGPVAALDERIRDFLGELGHFVGADRSFVSLVSMDGEKLSVEHSWCADGVSLYPSGGDSLPVASIPWSMARLRAGEAVVAVVAEELPEEARRERATLIALGIQSIVNVPVRIEGDLLGIVGFDWLRAPLQHAEEIVPLLELAAEVLASALHRARWISNLLHVVQGTATQDGTDFFEALVRLLSLKLKASVCFVAELIPGDAGRVRTIAACRDGVLVPGFEFDLKGTPCEEVVGKTACWYARDVQTHFPEDTLLRELDAEAYGASPIFDAAGTPLGLISFVYREPVTRGDDRISMVQVFAPRAAAEIRRLRADRARRQTEAWLTAIVENSPAMVYLKDVEGRYILGNRPWRDQFGVALEQIGTITDWQVFPPDVAASLRSNDEQALEGGKAIQFEEALPVGERRRTYLSVKFPVYDARDDLLGICGVSTDITDRKWAEEELARKERYYRALIEHAQDLVWVLNADATTRYVSPAVLPLLGYEPGGMEGQSILQYCHPEDRSVLADALRDPASRPPHSHQIKCRVRHLGGEWRTLDFVVSNLLSDPDLAGVVVNARDVTEEVALERQFLQAQKMEAVGRLAGGIAHDFNNLLTAISGYTVLMKRDLEKGISSHQDLEEISGAVRRASRLTRQLLTLGSRQVTRPKVIDLSDIVAAMEGMLRRLIGEDITLETRLAKGLHTVLADPGQIEQMIMNLVVNARDAMPEGGVLRIETEMSSSGRQETDKSAPRVSLLVSDTGQGIDPKDRPHIFEPFFTTKEKSKGTGLGLAAVYGIARQCGGTVSVESQIGVGSRFRIDLPASNMPADPVERVLRQPDQGRDAAASETVLLVEDEAIVRDLSAKLLLRQGYRVLVASDGMEALRIYDEAQGRVDLLLTDVVMPGLSGPELAKRLRLKRQDLAVLFMSGYSWEHSITEELGVTGSAYLEKPFVPDDLLRKVRQLLGPK